MSNFMIENPWNDFLEKFVINSNNHRKLKEATILKSDENIHLCQSLPIKFQKLRDLVTCNHCNILVSKKHCLFHSKCHETSLNSILPYNAFPSDDNGYIPSRSRSIPFLNSNNDKLTHTILKDKKRKIIKKPKQSKHNDGNKVPPYDISTQTKIDKHKTKSEENHSNFIPKTILNTSDPLKLKIRLQPKCGRENIEKNGNIFDNLNSYCNDMKNNQTNKSQRVRSMNELVNNDFRHYQNISCDNINRLSNDEDDNQSLLLNSHRESAKNVFSAENILKIRRMESREGNDKWPSRLSIGPSMKNAPSSLPAAIPIVAKRFAPAYPQTNSNTKTSLFPTSVQSQPPTEDSSSKVFHSFSDKFIRINGQRKCVRIQQVQENPSNWQISASENLPTSFRDQEATQKQFQRRLIQKGMFSDKDVIRCTRPSTETDPVHRRKITIVNGSLSSNDSCFQLVRKATPMSSTAPADYSRINESRHCLIPVPPVTTRSINHNNFHDKNKSLRQAQSAVHNTISRNCHNGFNMELSDEEFILDSPFQSPHDNVNTFMSTTALNSVPSQYHSNVLVSTEPNSHSYNTRSYQNSEAEIFSNYRTDESTDPTMHFLPSPGRQITDLPWDI